MAFKHKRHKQIARNAALAFKSSHLWIQAHRKIFSLNHFLPNLWYETFTLIVGSMWNRLSRRRLFVFSVSSCLSQKGFPLVSPAFWFWPFKSSCFLSFWKIYHGITYQSPKEGRERYTRSVQWVLWRKIERKNVPFFKSSETAKVDTKARSRYIWISALLTSHSFTRRTLSGIRFSVTRLKTCLLSHLEGTCPVSQYLNGENSTTLETFLWVKV